MIQTTLKKITMPQAMTQATIQNRATQGGATLDQDLRPLVEFDQWAIAVREQMVTALKRRGSN